MSSGLEDSTQASAMYQADELIEKIKVSPTEFLVE